LCVIWYEHGAHPPRRIWRILLISWLLILPWLIPSLLDFTTQYESAMEHSWESAGGNGISPLTRWVDNFSAIILTLWNYITPFLFLLALAEIVRSLLRRDKTAWLLLLAALDTLIFFCLMADQIHYRYILPAFPFLLVLAAYNLVVMAHWLWKQIPALTPRFRSIFLVGLMLLVSLHALRFDYLLLTDPPHAPWLSGDRYFFIDSPLSGYGIVEASGYLRQQADQLGRIIVVIKRANDHKPIEREKRTSVWRYYLNRSDIRLEPIDLRATPQELIQALHNTSAPVFVALDRPSEDAYAIGLTEGAYTSYSDLVATFPRPGLSRIEVYRLIAKPQ
jgi:hypothetical protein